ncbi:MAG TPA: hypothetical protein VJG32_09415 [Anaerolineae bacterium]|nr:hypothetical protein [Anaerolineae bacterium]
MADRSSLHVSRFTLHVSRFWPDLVVVAAIFLTTMLLYGASLAYPFVWYDSADVLRAMKYSVFDLFAGVAGYEYYRPLIFTFWQLILNAWGAASAPMFHASLIGAHVLSGVLLYALARELTRRRASAAAAALLFVVYPFSYQAVTWAIAHQPPSLVFVLASLLVYVRARLKGRETEDERPGTKSSLRVSSLVIRHSAALACLVAAMLLHESAFVGAGLVLLLEAYLVLGRRVPRASIAPLAYLAVTLIVFAVYSAAAKTSPNEETLQPITGLYLLQGLIYPLAMITAQLCQAPGCDSVAWLLPVAGLTLIGLVAAWRSARTLLIGALGTLWFGLSVAPVWAGRDYVYVEYAPRLLYLAGAGAALAIAAALDAGDGRWQGLLRAGLVALILFQSGQFVMARQTLHTDAFQLLEQENRALLAAWPGSALFVNTVELFTRKQSEFPLGWFGVLVSPWHNPFIETKNLRAQNADWVIDPAQAEGAAQRSRLKLEFHGRIVTPEQFRAALAAAAEVYRVEALTAPAGDLHLFKVAGLQRQVDPPAAVAEWSAVRLAGASVDMEAGIPVLNLAWWIAGLNDAGQTVFVHVRNAAGEIVAQADGDPIGGMAPFNSWATGDLIRERRPLLLPPDSPAGTYTVAVGLYGRATLERTTPTRANIPLSDGALVVGSFDIP